MKSSAASSVLSMIVERVGYIKLEDGGLKVRLKKFNNLEIGYAAGKLGKN